MAADDAATSQIHLEEITAISSPSTVAHARELLLEYGRFVLAETGPAHFCYGALEKEAARLPASYIEQGGGSLIAYAHHLPAGFVAWRAMSASAAPNSCEMKRLWVRPSGRGLALGRTLTVAVIDRARAAGCTSIFLDTIPAAMAAAHRIYVDLGFQPCAPYNDNPYEGIAHFRKDL